MLQVAKKRLQNEKRKAVPRKPKPPDRWDYDQGYVIRFFWDWQRAEYDPRLTPNNRPWDEQDEGFWSLVYYIKELWEWAYHRAKNPVMQIRAGDQGMEDI